MRTLSLNDLPDAGSALSADVCIVGAGAAGLFLASRLSGVSTILLDAGPEVCVQGASLGFEARCPSDLYKGVTEGRSFGLGGSTSRWGGALAPFGEQDLRAPGDPHSAAWRMIVAAIRSHSARVAANLGMPLDPAAPASPTLIGSGLANRFLATGLQVRLASWLPFRRRNLAFLATRGRRQDDATRVILDAVACRWKLDDGAGHARFVDIEARNRAGRRLTVRARVFVVAAGAIESTRILQEINAAHADRVLPARAALGRCLSDHLSWRAGRVTPADTAQSIRQFGPRISRGCLRSFRFVESAPAHGTPRYFAHVLYDDDSPGFRLAREFLRAAQMRRPPNLRVGDGLRGVTGLVLLAYKRFLRSRLHIPDSSPAYLQIDMEQEARQSNRIALDTDKDAYGRPKAIVSWSLSDADCRQLVQASRQFLSRWSAIGSAVPALTGVDSIAGADRPHDVYHPVGTCRAGTDPEAVVDTDLRVHGTNNLFVLSTAVFPTAGTANPTFALLCLADRLSERIRRFARAA